ncbi:MAG: anthranilate phosphoribosyltransferase [Gammaproteobacteria bacterium]|nr:anthranilate phosphoribosyltransferase [Gammaproteobacteria bacterium]MAY03584.1 anthranilate phosphoribosyltransferase [Gammaproteobacteria bacterium]|tara:strand:- start:269103 stop:270128 length:1026 start_codon:yes stop_codon:yes gene_type:complete
MTDTPTALKPYIAKVTETQTLSFAEASEAFEIIMSGGATPAQIAGFLVALRMRGEDVSELSAAVNVIRSKALPVKAPAGAIDIVGTGGDGSGTLNISTATAIVVAGCGVPVAKHGNRALSSKSGTADVLAALGVNLDAPVEKIEQAISEAGIGFMLAPRHHASFKYVGPVRMELGIRTMFNILGPLCNPAGVSHYLLGVFSRDWVKPMAQVLARLGCKKAWVVHGADGLDELSTTGENIICEVDGSEVREFSLSPDTAGIARASLDELKGGDADYNAGRLQALLSGQQDAYRDIVLFDAAAALLISGKVGELAEGVTVAAEAIDSGAAQAALDGLVAISNS